MNTSMSRRQVLAAPLALAGCVAAGPYFGKTTPPGSQRLVHSNGEEPSSLDPALSVGAGSDVIAALLDSLTALDPVTRRASRCFGDSLRTRQPRCSIHLLLARSS